jgi:cell division septal protein FtsQ
MWFGRQNRPTTKVEARIGDQRQARRKRIKLFVVMPLVGVAAAVILVLIGWKLGEALFWGNPRYTIRKLVIRVDGRVITPQTVRDYTHLAEGMNLYAFSIRKVRASFLKTPVVKSMTMVRSLPDTLEIEVTERTAVAKIGANGIDREGWVFFRRAGGREIPAVTGIPDQTLRPGMRVDQTVMNALELVDACNRSKQAERIKIASVDVSGKEFLELYLEDGERIKVAWEDMGRSTPAARQSLERKIGQIAKALRASAERGRRLVNLDLTFHDQYAPAQEF